LQVVVVGRGAFPCRSADNDEHLEHGMFGVR